MQSTDICGMPNSTGWRVAHNGETNMFFLKNDNGNSLPESFTKRVFAQKRLLDYLTNLNSRKVKNKNKPIYDD